MDRDPVAAVDALLADPEAQYRFLVDESSDILAIHEPDGRLRWISPAVERILGWTAEDRRTLHLDLVHPDDPPLLTALGEQLSAGVESATARIRLLHRGGGHLWAESTARAVRDDGGRISALVVVTRDVSDEVVAERALADIGRRYRLIADNTSDFVVLTGPDGVIEWASPSATCVLGWSLEEVHGRHAAEFIPPEDLPDMENAQAQVNDGQIVRGRVRVRCSDGSYRWFSRTLQPVYDDAGNLTGRVAGYRDIEAEVETEVALARSLEFFRMMAENASDVILRIGKGGIIEWVSPSAATTFGWDFDHLKGARDVDFIHPDEREAFVAEAERMEAAGEPVVLTFRLRRGDGSYSWVEAASQYTAATDTNTQMRIVRLRDVDAQVGAFEALARSEERFRSAMQNAGIGMCLNRPDGSYIEVNPSLCAFLGRDADYLMSRDWQEFTHPEDLNADLDLLQQIVDGRINNYRFAKRFIRGDGTTVYGDMSVTGVRDDSGQLEYFVTQIVDSTEQVRSRQALAASEEHFRLLAENASDVVVHVKDGNVEWISPSVREALGWLPEQWLGHEAVWYTHPDDKARQVDARVKVLEGETTRYRIRLRSTTGEYHWAEVHARPYVADDGSIRGIAASFRIIDDWIAAQEALARSEELFRTAMESAPAGMALIDLDRHFVEVNPALCRMLDRDEAWLLEHRVIDIVCPEDDSIDLRMRAEVLSTGNSSITREKRLVRSDGSIVWVEHAIGLLRDDDGIPQGYVSQFVNITETRQAREELRFMATHDPLTRLVNRPELLSRMDNLLTRLPRTGTKVATLFIDLDDLKGINDTYGHGAGDAVIVEVAERLRQQVRSDDLVARLGGDEYVVILPAIHSIEDARRIAEKMQMAVSRPMIVESHEISVTLSIGVSLAGSDDSADRVLEFADRALYHAKRTGRARTVTYDEALRAAHPEG